MDDDQTMDAIQKEFILKKGSDGWESSDDEYVPPKIDNDEYWKNYENEILVNQFNNDTTNYEENYEEKYQANNQTNYEEKYRANNEAMQELNIQNRCKECGNTDLFTDKIGKFVNYCYICKLNVK